MRYDRLTRNLFVDVKGAEYALRLNVGKFEEIEDLLPKGETLVSMFLNSKTPQIKVLRKTFCVGLSKDGETIKGQAADKVFEDFIDEHGVQMAVNVFYAALAASRFLGAAASNVMLEGLGLVVKDKEPEEADEKNV